MDDDTKFVIIAISSLIGIALTLIVVIAFINYEYESNIYCPRFAANIERPMRYDFWGGGCFVQTKQGQWVRDKNYWNNVPTPDKP